MAFSDPNCPACQELEREAASLKSGQGFAVIPVGFQPGSRVLAAKVLCAKDQARAWADALRGVAPNEQPCEAGLRKVDENNNLFASIGASATPTLVSANGQLAQGSAPSAQLQLFASSYAK
jgi:thiol:disulfide interchange protein DsbC